MELMKNAADINKAITSIAGRGAKLDKDIQHVGLSVMQHAAEHGDSTLADKLVQAMPKGGRKLALVEWMLAYSPIVVLDKVQDKDAIAAGRVFKLDRTKKLDLVGAAEKPWHEFRKEAAVQDAFDAGKAVTSVLARLNAAAKDGLAIEGKDVAIQKVEALLAVLKA